MLLCLNRPQMRKRMAFIAAFVKSIEGADTLSHGPLLIGDRPATADTVPVANCADTGVLDKGVSDTISLVVRSGDLCSTPVRGSSVPVVDSPTSVESPPPKKLRPRNAELALSIDPQSSC